MRWTILAVATFTQAAAAFFAQGIGALGVQLRLDLGIGTAELGLLISAVQFAPLLGLVIAGELLDRFGERWVVSAGAAVVGFALLAGAFSPGYASLLVALLVVGAGYSTVQPGGSKSVASWFDASRRGTAMGIRQAGLPLGAALASATLPAIGATHGWPATLTVGGAVALTGAAAFVVIYRRPPSLTPANPVSPPPTTVEPHPTAHAAVEPTASAHAATEPHSTPPAVAKPDPPAPLAGERSLDNGAAMESQPWDHAATERHPATLATGERSLDKGAAEEGHPSELTAAERRPGDRSVGVGGSRLALLKMAATRKALLCGVSLVSVQVGIGLLTVLHLHDVAGMAAGRAALILVLAQGAGVAGRIILAALSDRAGVRRQGVVTGSLVAVLVALGLLLTPVGHHPVAAGVIFGWLGFFGIGWYGPWVALVSEAAPVERTGFALGLAMSVNQVAIVAVPPLLGLLRDVTGGFTASWGLLAVMTGAALLVTVAPPRVSA